MSWYQNAIFYQADDSVLRILIKFSRHVPNFPIYSNGTKPGALHTDFFQRSHFACQAPGVVVMDVDFSLLAFREFTVVA